MSENGLRSVTDVLLAVAAEPSTGRRLHMLVDAARDAVAATYGAIGVPDGEGGFARFVTSGMSEDEIARIGPLPRTHGLLAAMLERPLRSAWRTSGTTRATGGGRRRTR